MGTVSWSPRFLGAGEYPYTLATKASQFHVDASLWVIASTQAEYNSVVAATPRVGLWINPAIDQSASALMVDAITSLSMKPSWFSWVGSWYGCVNRPAFLNSVVTRIRTLASWGVTDVQMDDPEVNHQLSRGLAYIYGSGSVVGTNGTGSIGCRCSDCVARASALGFGTLTSSNVDSFAKNSVTNFWTVIGSEVRSNSMKWSANLRATQPLGAHGFTPERFHYPMHEEYAADVSGDGTIDAWQQHGSQFVTTYAVNTQTSYEQAFGATDKTRRWFALRYAVGGIPIAPWDVYAGTGVARVFARREDVADLAGFVRGKASSLFNGYSLASALGETMRWPTDREVAAWADTPSVFVSVRYRGSDGKRVIHAVDLRDTPATFNLSWWSSVVGAGAVTAHAPATYNQSNQDAAIASGDRAALSVTSTPTVTGSAVRTAQMTAGLWRIVEVSP